MSRKVPLKIAIAEFPHTSAVRNGSIPIEGVEAEILTVNPQIGAFRRMVRDVEFDVCELAPTTYVIARAYGAPFVALPIFVTRRFHHSGLLVRPDAGIKTPKDLEGKKVGVRAYSVTTGAWTRQVLIDEFGLDSSKVTWVVDDEEHVTQMKLPSNVIHAAEGSSLADMMADERKLVMPASMPRPASAGPAPRPAAGKRSRRTIRSSSRTRPSWKPNTTRAPTSTRCTARSWSKTPCWPSIPGSARSLFDAFSQARKTSG